MALLFWRIDEVWLVNLSSVHFIVVSVDSDNLQFTPSTLTEMLFMLVEKPVPII